MPSAHTFQQRQKSPYIGLGLQSINHSLNSKELRVIYTTRNNPVRLHEPPLTEITSGVQRLFRLGFTLD